jgi:hypothetical protein
MKGMFRAHSEQSRGAYGYLSQRKADRSHASLGWAVGINHIILGKRCHEGELMVAIMNR